MSSVSAPASDGPPGRRIGERLRWVRGRGSRLLVVYLTLGDPLLSDPIGAMTAAVAAGADALELGIPTLGTRPRGAIMADSFRRADGAAPDLIFGMLRDLRSALPDTPLLPLVYPATVSDLGLAALVSASASAGADGLVLTQPAGTAQVAQIVAGGLSAIPVVRSDDATTARRMETAADRLTYQMLAPTTGALLDPVAAGELTAALARTATKPFLAGFGIRGPRDIRAVGRHADGVVIGSEAYRVLARSDPAERADALASAIRTWKAAMTFTDIGTGRDLTRRRDGNVRAQ
nr:tryptophan synthase subunit alpha [Micromonospora sp. DSM 115978]